MSNLIATDLQGQSIDSPLINLFEVSLPSGSKVYLHSGVDESLTNVQFRDFDDNAIIRSYSAFPILVDGMEQASDGALNRPTLTIANIGNNFKQILSGYSNKDLIGQRITRRQTLQKYLYGESPDLSNPPVEMSRITYTIDRVARETSVAITYELSAVHDLEGIKLPRRTLVGKYCSWIYQGHEFYDKGGCTWISTISDQTPGQEDTRTLKRGAFFDVDNTILAHEDVLSSNSTTWNDQSTYAIDAYVVKNGYYYVSKGGANTGKNPSISANDAFWDSVRAYTTWSSSSVSYTKGDLVRHFVTLNGKTLDTIFIALTNHTSGATNEPSLDSSVWQKEELCAKTLQACKCRFGARVKASTTVSSNDEEVLVRHSKKRGITLPFGSFPGATKFR